jgi:hypothetical protein
LTTGYHAPRCARYCARYTVHPPEIFLAPGLFLENIGPVGNGLVAPRLCMDAAIEISETKNRGYVTFLPPSHWQVAGEHYAGKKAPAGPGLFSFTGTRRSPMLS